MIPYIIIGLSLLTLIFYIIVLFFLFEIKKRLKNGINISIGYLTISILFLIIIRINDVLGKAEIFTFNIPYLHESLVVLFSFFLLIAIITLYKNLIGFQNRKKICFHSKKLKKSKKV